MFRITQFMKEIHSPTPVAPKRVLPGPVVIWNLIRRCNLKCLHCYSISADHNFQGELTTDEVFQVMNDLKQFGVKVLILSGGEPLLRPDIFEISHHAKAMGFYVALSSNGTLIDERNIQSIADVGYDYVGVSIDGIAETHDYFRRKQGAFEASMKGIRLARQHGIKVGIRFTLTENNAQDFHKTLSLLDQEDLNKYYLSHLNYSGRGKHNRKRDAYLETTRQAMEHLFEISWQDVQKGGHKEFVTGNNDADGAFLLFWIKNHFPDKVDHIQKKLEQWGGNSTGVNVANIDNLGNVHPDTFWWDYSLGNVRERPFSEIWKDTTDPIMAGLKAEPRTIEGRCSACQFFKICNGNTRVRARLLTGNPWAEDPGCYLSDDEISPPSSRPIATNAQAIETSLSLVN